MAIVWTPDIRSGSPRIDGTRLSCLNVAMDLAGRFSVDRYLTIHPHLTRADLIDCLEYCSQQKCTCDQPLHYCEQCTLDDRTDTPPAWIIENGKIVANPNAGEFPDNHIYGGSLEELEQDVRVDGWMISQQVLADLKKNASGDTQ